MTETDSVLVALSGFWVQDWGGRELQAPGGGLGDWGGGRHTVGDQVTQTTMRYHCTPTRMVAIVKRDSNKCWGGWGEMRR